MRRKRRRSSSAPCIAKVGATSSKHKDTAMNRRTFLQLSASAATAAALAPSILAATPKRNLRKAIMYSTIGVKGSVLERFKAMKEAGFEGVEPMGGMDREEVIAAFKETGLQAASVCCH